MSVTVRWAATFCLSPSLPTPRPRAPNLCPTDCGLAAFPSSPVAGQLHPQPAPLVVLGQPPPPSLTIPPSVTPTTPGVGRPNPGGVEDPAPGARRPTPAPASPPPPDLRPPCIGVSIRPPAAAGQLAPPVDQREGGGDRGLTRSWLAVAPHSPGHALRSVCWYRTAHWVPFGVSLPFA